jgi:hypothetical protein
MAGDPEGLKKRRRFMPAQNAYVTSLASFQPNVNLASDGGKSKQTPRESILAGR